MIENFTGAEVESFVNNATKYVLSRNIDGTDVGNAPNDIEDYMLTWDDFMKTIANYTWYLNSVISRTTTCPSTSNGIIDYGDGYKAGNTLNVL